MLTSHQCSPHFKGAISVTNLFNICPFTTIKIFTIAFLCQSCLKKMPNARKNLQKICQRDKILQNLVTLDAVAFLTLRHSALLCRWTAWCGSCPGRHRSTLSKYPKMKSVDKSYLRTFQKNSNSWKSFDNQMANGHSQIRNGIHTPFTETEVL